MNRKIRFKDSYQHIKGLTFAGGWMMFHNLHRLLPQSYRRHFRPLDTKYKS
jgi:hypothetical protein